MGDTCEYCGKEFGDNNGANRFCSRDCYGSWLSENKSGKDHHQSQQKEVDCAWCGETLLRAPNRLERSDNHFCDNDCYTKWRSENVVGENHHNYKESVEIECANCSDVFEANPSRKDKAKYCSRECMAIDYRGGLKNKPSIECEYCGEVVTVMPRESDNRRFCSKNCFYKWRSESGSVDGENNPSWGGGLETVNCMNCGETIKRPPSQLSDRPFCSRSCLHEWLNGRFTKQDHPRWNGGSIPYGSGWSESLKEKIRERQNHKCDGCGMPQEKHLEEYGKRLHVHHKIKARTFGEGDESKNEKQNLAALCVPCHWTAEKMAPLYPFGDS